ncbi:UvrD-helicase domain-containing protein [Paenibacillus solisilvae]|uniref:DNA 3'-5' helicase n=1 Tax=Paenibacillus solisilvae TaxID=2486751 RepID=A0ABW0VV81_9BACL
MIKRMDDEARSRILSDLNTTLMVEAGAGSGKTTSLVGRMLSLVRTGASSVQAIAAITFTNKASEELWERFRLALERESNRTHGVEQERLQAALRHIDQCFIGTIHSFCGMLLRERPIEAGLDPLFVEIDEDGEKAFQSQCWDDYLAMLRENGSETELNELLRLEVDIVTLRRVYERVSIFSDVQIPTDPRALKPDIDRIRLSLFPLMEEAYPFIPSNEPEKGWDTLQKLLREVKRQEQYIDHTDEIAFLRLAKRFNRKLKVTQKYWHDKKQAKAFLDRFHEWQIKVLFPFLEDWQVYLYPKLIGFVVPIVRYCEQRRRSSGMISFQDLLERATGLLREHGEVRAYYAERFERLLVDEFQDTDPIQAEMMFLLAGGGAGTDSIDWRKLNPRPGSLFIVGDPKQSIYRFRRADISIYNEVKERVAACGDVLTLSSNFRSVPSIGDFVNYQFINRFPAIASEEQAAFVRMETQMANPGDKEHKVDHGIKAISYPKLIGGKHQIAETDAKRIASYIAWACSKGNLQIQEKAEANGEWLLRDAVPGDFLILLKTKEFLHLYAEYLDRYGIAADTSGSAVLYEEMLAVAELAKLLNDSTDHAALLAVLRGMLFGISDRALMAYKREGHSFSYYLGPTVADCSETSRPIAEALAQLRLYSDWVRRLPALAALMRIIEDCGLLSYIAVQEAGAIRAGSMIKLLHILQGEPEAVSSWPALTMFLSQATQGRGLESMSLYAGGSGAVRIMNLHKAKGLEAPVVFLACPCGESDHDADQFIDRGKVPGEGYFTITRKLYEHVDEVIAQPPGWTDMSEKERLFMNAEKDRLLYVAATRAKQLLVVSLYPEQPAKCPWSSLMEGMEHVPELSVLEQKPTPRQAYTGEPRLHEFHMELSSQLEEVSRASYKQVSVTELTKSVGDAPEWSSKGRGQAFGSVVHRCLEALGIGRIELPELTAYVQFLAGQEELASEFVPAAAETVLNVLGSELWQRSLRAKRRLHEVSLYLTKRTDGIDDTNDAHSVLGNTEVAAAGDLTLESVYVKGVIDFLFEEEDGWVIVDFKTDVFELEKEADFVRFYKPQVQVYANEWSRSFGYTVKETGLFFTQHQKYVKL